MTKVLRFLAICTLGVALATSSIAWAQTYKTVDFPGAGGHHSKRRTRSAGHQRRQLDGRRRRDTWFYVNQEGRIHIVRPSGFHTDDSQLHQPAENHRGRLQRFG